MQRELDQGLFGPKVAPEILLPQLDDLLRHKPSVDHIADQSDDVLAWRGRAAAVIKAWSDVEGIALGSVFMNIDSVAASRVSQGYSRLIRCFIRRAIRCSCRR
jgi:hypothetical protein